MKYFIFFILIIAVIFDIIEYKIPNILIVLSLVTAFFYKGISCGPPGLLKYLLHFFGMLIIIFPLYCIKALGAGDCKLFLFLSSSIDLITSLKILFVSLIAGLVFGMIKILTCLVISKFSLKQLSHTESDINSILTKQKTNKILNKMYEILPSNLVNHFYPFINAINKLTQKFRFHYIHFSLAILAGYITILEVYS